MPAKVWVFPGAMAEGGDPVWQSPPPGLRQLAEIGEVIRISHYTNRASVLGWSRAEEIANGPLVCAAFNLDPPARSACFELSLLSVDDDGQVSEVGRITETEAVELALQLPRLATKSLIPKWGSQTTHALVWERGSASLWTAKPAEIVGKGYTEQLPLGDGEPMLRQLIDDSVNLLDSLEINRIREGEGLPKANLLWPHGCGFMPSFPNLALQRGELATLHSDSIYAEGLSRLAGYRHASRSTFRDGVHVSESAIATHARGESTDILVDPGLGNMLRRGRGDETEYALSRFDKFGWEPLVESILKGTQIRVGILCPGGLGIVFGPGFHPNAIPFDTRAIDDARLRSFPLAEVAAKLLEPAIG